jgi:hypothetical protein
MNAEGARRATDEAPDFAPDPAFGGLARNVMKAFPSFSPS